jgi:hypothetical protein
MRSLGGLILSSLQSNIQKICLQQCRPSVQTPWTATLTLTRVFDIFALPLENSKGVHRDQSNKILLHLVSPDDGVFAPIDRR